MGLKLKEIYDEAKRIGGLKAELRLVMISKITRAQAVTEPDTADKITSCTSALNEIKKEFR